jgi:hypothetical protein
VSLDIPSELKKALMEMEVQMISLLLRVVDRLKFNMLDVIVGMLWSKPDNERIQIASLLKNCKYYNDALRIADQLG